VSDEDDYGSMFGDDEPPVEPTAEQRAFARSMRGIFVSLRAAGFTEPQAIQVVASMTAAAVTKTYGDE
jgi:hypothetical protein